MRIKKTGQLTQGTDANISSCTFPHFTSLPGGRMLATFKGSPLKGPLKGENAYICYSSDGGYNWSDPVAPFPASFLYEGRRGTFRGMYATHIEGSNVLAVMSVVYDDGQDIPFFNEETEGLLDTDIFYAFSSDYGLTFGAPIRMDTSPFNQPVPLTGPVLRLANGDLMCQFELNKTYNDPVPWIHSSVGIFSGDDGRSWGEATAITRHPTIYYWDQRPAVLSDGRILNLFWSFDRESATYLNIHGSESFDNGRTWSPLWDTGLPGQPGASADIGGGRTAVIYIDRTNAPKIIVKTSLDCGRTFEPGELAVYDAALPKQEVGKSTMQDAWSEMGAFSVGHPGLTLLPDGDLLAFYYSGPHTDRTDVQWARIEL